MSLTQLEANPDGWRSEPLVIMQPVMPDYRLCARWPVLRRFAQSLIHFSDSEENHDFGVNESRCRYHRGHGRGGGIIGKVSDDDDVGISEAEVHRFQLSA